MKSTFSETLLVAMLPFVIATSNLTDWVAIVVGILSAIWITCQLISRVRKDLEDRRKQKSSKPVFVLKNSKLER